MKHRLLFLCVIITGLVHTVVAQIHNETGDAGDLPETAQNTGTAACALPLAQINGSLSLNDVDMYAICISDPVLFRATTFGGANFDTQLWLFDSNGNGITHNDDAPPGGQGVHSTLTGQFVPSPGTYYLAISRYNRDAYNCDDLLIWRNSPSSQERAPDGPGASGRVAAWMGTTTGGVTYSITLEGTRTSVRISPRPCDHFEGWDEARDGGGDAGDLPETAQPTGETECGQVLPRIRGELTPNDTDIYLIYIHNPAIFRATTVSGSTADTQLWLFDISGDGVAFNDNAGGLQSTLTGLFVLQPGIYSLAITLYNRNAVDCSGIELWADEPRDVEREPDGSGSGRVSGWNGSTGSASYVIELTGVCTTSAPDPPPPCEFSGWDEMNDGGSDAGELPASAQKIFSTGTDPCQTPVRAVRGALSANDADMYVICITDANTFHATTVGGAGFDTQLWLFNCDGTGVTFNDDTPSGGLQSTITGQFITQTGIYLLAISRWDNDPLDAGGSEIWVDTPTNTEREPDGPGLSNPVAQWSGDTDEAGPYIIRLQGAYFVDETGCGSGCTGDVNEDGCVDDADLLLVLFNFGQSGSGVPGDRNGDSVVDDADLLLVLFDFGCGC